MNIKIYCVVFLLFIFDASYSQKERVCKLCLNGGVHQHISPYDFSLKKELPFVFSSAGLIVFSEISRLKNDTKPFTEKELGTLNRNDVNPFDRPTTYKYNTNAAKASDIIRTGVLILPAFFLAHHNTRDDIGHLVLLTTEVIALNWGVTNSVKHIVNRTRPNVYNENLNLEIRTSQQSRLSFFSGHTSNTAAITFMSAKVINDYHPEMVLKYKLGLWGIAAIIPAATAYLRVQSGNHFPTDVIVGYGVGATIGWLIPHLHKKKTNITLTPYSLREAKGVSFFYKF